MQLGQRLGEGIDPRMFVQDYSGFTRAAEIQAQGMQNLGAMIGKGISNFAEARQERKKIDAQIKADRASIESAIKLGDSLGFDVKGTLAPIVSRMDDPNTSPIEAAALGREAAGQIQNVLGLGFKAREMQQNESYRKAGLDLQAAELGIRHQARQQEAQTEAAKRTEGEISIFDPTIGKERKAKVWKDQFGNAFDWDTKKPIIDTEKYFYGEEGGLGELPPTSQINYEQLPSAGNWGFTSKTRDLLPKSTPDSRQVSLDFNAAASKDAKGVEIIIPNDASAIERAAAMDYVNQTKQYFAERGVDVPVRGVRTAKENGRGTPGRFHTEPFFVGHAEARKVMESDPDGYAQVLANTLGRIPNVTFIPPHKKNDPGAASGGFNERDFAKNAIIPALERLSRGDLSQQAQGTPEQQAEMARQIEQGAGMATAQSGGGMPTEPSMTQQQPKLPERRMVKGVPVGGGAAQFRPSTPEEEQMYGSKGQVNTATGEFKPIRPPSGMVIRQTPEGGLEFAQGPGATDRFAKAAEEAQKQQVQSADINVQDLMEIKRMYADINQKEGVGPAVKRSAESFVIGTPMYALKAEMIEPFKKRLGLEQLTKMRQASPTGGALGQVSNEEGTRLESIFGSLNPAASPRIFNRNVDRAIESYLDVIHGSIEERQKMVEEGKITAEQNAQIESLYPGSTMDVRGISQPRQTSGTGNPAIDEIIQRNNIRIK